MSLSDSREVHANAHMGDGVMSDLVRKQLEEIGEDPQREGLLKTPRRVEEAWRFLTSGYTANLSEIVNDAIFHEKCEEMVLVRHIHYYSLCEHHLLPFYGSCSIGYIPSGEVIGLSKLPRIVDMFARRLQLQERMTVQIAETLNEILEPQGVGVVTHGFHLCMMMRGVQKQDSLTTSSEMLGVFRSNPQTRSEFLSLIAGDDTVR